MKGKNPYAEPGYEDWGLAFFLGIKHAKYGSKLLEYGQEARGETIKVDRFGQPIKTDNGGRGRDESDNGGRGRDDSDNDNDGRGEDTDDNDDWNDD